MDDFSRNNAIDISLLNLTERFWRCEKGFIILDKEQQNSHDITPLSYWVTLLKSHENRIWAAGLVSVLDIRERLRREFQAIFRLFSEWFRHSHVCSLNMLKYISLHDTSNEGEKILGGMPSFDQIQTSLVLIFSLYLLPNGKLGPLKGVTSEIWY